MHGNRLNARVRLHNVDNSCIMWITLWIKSLVVSSLNDKIVDIVSFAGLVDNNVDNSAAEVASRAAERAALPAQQAAGPGCAELAALPSRQARPAKMACVIMTLALCTTAASAASTVKLACRFASCRFDTPPTPSGVW